jgi:glucans biosynthesis protein C
VDRNSDAGRVRSTVVPNLDTVRGLACLLVVALHVIGDQPTNGLRLPMDSPWHYVMESIEFLRMPLFTAMSGYLYAGRRVTKADFGVFWTKKFRRLVVPLMFVTFVVWALRGDVEGASGPYVDALFFSFGYLWYIQSLIVIFTVIALWDVLARPSNTALVIAGFFSIMICQSRLLLMPSGEPVTLFFSMIHSLYLLPHFIFGMLLRENPSWLRDRRTGTIALGVAGIVFVGQQLGMLGLAQEIGLLTLPSFVAGMAGTLFLLQRLPSNQLLATIGTYSYSIYLWHVVMSAAMRSQLQKFDIVSTPLLFAGCYVAAIAGSIVFSEIARRVPLLSVAATGERWKPFGSRRLARA